MYRGLLICNSDYPEDPATFPALNGPQVDGLRLWHALTDEQAGVFERSAVRVIHERSQREFLETVERFFADAGPRDTLLFYFSGHGFSLEGSLYLCARDTTSRRMRATGVSTDEISKMITDCPASAVVIILDCCFSGGFKGTASPKLGGEGRYVITATTNYALAPDAVDETLPSPFTAALIESLLVGAVAHGGGNTVDLDDLMRDLESRVPEDGPRPERDFDGSGRIVIARRSPVDEGSFEITPESRIEQREQPRQQAQHPLAWTSTVRQHGDLTTADISTWKALLVLGIAISVLGVRAYFEVYRSPWRDVEHVLTWIAAGTGLLIVLFSLLEGWWLRWIGVRRMRRRLVVETLANGYPTWLKVPFWTALVGSAGVVASPLTGRGVVSPAWTACIACMGLVLLIACSRRYGRGDDLQIAAACFIVIGNVLPIYSQDPFTEQLGFRSGAQSSLGIFWIALGLLMIGAWLWRPPTPVLAILYGLLLLTLTATIGSAMTDVVPHWITTLCGALLALLGLILGTGRPLPIQGAPG